MQSFDGGSKQMLNGTMVHEVFQKAATAKDFSLETLSKLADQALCSPQYLGQMYVVRLYSADRFLSVMMQFTFVTNGALK